ncbi:hypothetical protein Leryth_009426 [Lithospermum erythrorhizon]|nr:hypothetical protein Leryth_009426 [Lithospermum erythrorhizon]
MQFHFSEKILSEIVMPWPLFLSDPNSHDCMSRLDHSSSGETCILLVLKDFEAVQAMVQQAMHYIDQTPDVETKIELIKTLNNVSAGKIYVEIERARLIKRLAKIKEEQGLVAEAADLMQEIAVETFGAMAKTEKIAFILEQTDKIMSELKYFQERLVQESLKLITKEKKKSNSITTGAEENIL